jgi:hypothetical protein
MIMATIKKSKKKLDKKAEDIAALPLAELQQDIDARRTSLKALIAWLPDLRRDQRPFAGYARSRADRERGQHDQ